MYQNYQFCGQLLDDVFCCSPSLTRDSMEFNASSMGKSSAINPLVTLTRSSSVTMNPSVKKKKKHGGLRRVCKAGYWTIQLCFLLILFSRLLPVCFSINRWQYTLNMLVMSSSSSSSIPVDISSSSQRLLPHKNTIK